MRLFVIHTTKQRKKNIDQQKSCFSPPTIIPKPNNYCKHPPHCSKALKDPRTMRNREFPFLHISFLGLSLALPGHSLLLNTESPDAPAHPLPIAISRYQPLKKHLPNNHWTIYYCYTNEKKIWKMYHPNFVVHCEKCLHDFWENAVRCIYEDFLWDVHTTTTTTTHY